MASLNRVFLMGNLTRDPELRYTPKGTAVAKFGLAMNRVYKTDAGEEKEVVCFVDVEAWGRQAETCSQYLAKGSQAFVEGELQLDQWQDKTSGEKRSKLLVHAMRVQFLGKPRSAEARGRESSPERVTESAPSPGISGEGVQAEEKDDIPF